MKELLNDQPTTAPLSTADFANPARTETGALETNTLDESASFDSDHIPAESAFATRNPEAHNGASQAEQHYPLFAQDELESFRSQWAAVQTSFVDEPRTAVEQADSLVANVVKRIAEQFAFEREQLEKQWGRGENANTEDLRQALKRYRAFFGRLLAF
jgi:hypothetical protein